MDDSVLSYFGQKTILIAEDHPETRTSLENFLKAIFKEVITAEDGADCLEKVEYYKPDILITDIRMPEIDGLESIKKIRQTDHTLPIIIISAYNTVEYLLQASNLDIQGYLLKPLDIEDLNDLLTKIFNYDNIWIELKDKLKYSYVNSSLVYQNEFISFGHKENEFLNILVRNKGAVVSYEVLEELIWGKDNESMSFDSIRTLVKKLRKKIPIDIIENVSKSGYKISTL